MSTNPTFYTILFTRLTNLPAFFIAIMTTLKDLFTNILTFLQKIVSLITSVTNCVFTFKKIYFLILLANYIFRIRSTKNQSFMITSRQCYRNHLSADTLRLTLLFALMSASKNSLTLFLTIILKMISQMAYFLAGVMTFIKSYIANLVTTTSFEFEPVT